MENHLSQLISLSHQFGQNKEYIIAGGGNSSYKNQEKMWVKASGTSMAEIDEAGFVCLDRTKMQIISKTKYSDDVAVREANVKDDLHNAILFPKDKRPSVEASMHEIIRYPFIMHTHPTRLNGLLCAENSKSVIQNFFGDDVVYVEYIDPGYILFKAVDLALQKFRSEKGKEPQIIFLENHGVFVGANTCAEIEDIYKKIEGAIAKEMKEIPESSDSESEISLENTVKSIKANWNNEIQFDVIDNSSLCRFFVNSEVSFSNVSVPFTPDNIVYCKSKYLFLANPKNIKHQIDEFQAINGYLPKIIAVKRKGIIALEESQKSAQIVMDVFKDMMKVSYLTNAFGGPRPMTQQQIDFIDNWEVENYRRQMSKATK